jgi:hypothetical protein
MGEIFKIASNISTPLALGGLFAAILFFIFRQILRMGIFPRLNQALGGQIVLNIINKLFILALVAMILGFTGYVIARAFPHTTPPLEDTVSVNVPDGHNLRETIKYFAQADDAAVVFSETCDKTILDSEVKGGVFTAPNTKRLIENLQFRLKNPPPDLHSLHANLKEKGLYEISCN